MAGHDIDQNDLAAERLYDLTADYFLARIVAALDQHFRLYATDQLFWCIFIEYGDEIDCLERSKHLGACLHWLNRTANAF